MNKKSCKNSSCDRQIIKHSRLSWEEYHDKDYCSERCQKACVGRKFNAIAIPPKDYWKK